MTTPRRCRVILLVLAGLFLVPSIAQAQNYAVDKGSFLIGGDVNINGSGLLRSSGGRSLEIQLNPSAQYFVLPGLAVGGGLQLSHIENSSFYRSTSYGIGPNISYYFGRDETRVFPYVSAGVNLVRSSTERTATTHLESVEVKWKNTALAADLSGGLLFMLTRGVGLSGELFYNAKTFWGVGGGVDSNRLGFRIGVSAFVF